MAYLANAAMPSKYYEIINSKYKRTYFINHIYKIVKSENQKILLEREFVKSFFAKGLLHLSFTQMHLEKLKTIQSKYEVKSLFNYEDYLSKIDIVPPSLAIAQAIVESGWGESRFVYEANNIFGQWTYFGDGIVPFDRGDEASHKIKIFQSIEDSVFNYLLNINIGWGYQKLRKQRLQIRLDSKNPYTKELVPMLHNYSGVGDEYMKILREIIRINKLDDLDRKFYDELKYHSIFGASLCNTSIRSF